MLRKIPHAVVVCAHSRRHAVGSLAVGDDMHGARHAQAGTRTRRQVEERGDANAVGHPEPQTLEVNPAGKRSRRGPRPARDAYLGRIARPNFRGGRRGGERRATGVFGPEAGGAKRRDLPQKPAPRAGYHGGGSSSDNFGKSRHRSMRLGPCGSKYPQTETCIGDDASTHRRGEFHLKAAAFSTIRAADRNTGNRP